MRRSEWWKVLAVLAVALLVTCAWEPDATEDAAVAATPTRVPKALM